MAIQKINDLKSVMTIFDDIKEVYHSSIVVNDASDLAKAANDLKQLPITDDGVNLNFGGVTLNNKKLNTGHVWGSSADREDPDVSFNVADVGADTSGKFMSAADTSDSVSVDGESYNAVGYSLDIKSVGGSLWFRSENKEGWLVLPNVKMYGGLNGTNDNSTAYYECHVSPDANSEGASLYILRKGAKSTVPGEDEE